MMKVLGYFLIMVCVVSPADAASPSMGMDASFALLDRYADEHPSQLQCKISVAENPGDDSCQEEQDKGACTRHIENLDLLVVRHAHLAAKALFSSLRQEFTFSFQWDQTYSFCFKPQDGFAYNMTFDYQGRRITGKMSAYHAFHQSVMQGFFPQAIQTSKQLGTIEARFASQELDCLVAGLKTFLERIAQSERPAEDKESAASLLGVSPGWDGTNFGRRLWMLVDSLAPFKFSCVRVTIGRYSLEGVCAELSGASSPWSVWSDTWKRIAYQRSEILKASSDSVAKKA